jgi:hypothetical protein
VRNDFDVDMLRELLRRLRADGFEVDELQRAALGVIERVSAKKPAVDTSP